MKIFFKHFLLFLVFLSIGLLSEVSAQCSVNAGGNITICGTSYTLQGSSTGTTVGNPTWTLVSKPVGAPDPVISNINSYTPNVTGMTSPGNYVFQISQMCASTGTTTSQVTVTAPGATTGFTAGPDITGIPAATGVANLNATIPAGYTASWTYYNIYSYEFNSSIVTTNATMSNTTTATPTLTLTNKANHTIDPAYRVILRITSIINPNCWYEDDAIVRFIPNPDMLFPVTYSQCINPGTTGANFFYDPNSTSSKFSTSTTNSAGNPAFGTTVTMTVVSQPSGANMQYSRMENGRLYFSGITATGDYIFDLTISNSLGSFTKRLTYTFRGYQPGFLDFIDPAYPNQMEVFSTVGTAGSVYCNMVGSTAPITFYFQINSVDPPATTTSVTPSGVIPSGGAPSIVQTGAGTMNRSVILTPPAGGWRAGTYRFSINVVAPGGCSRTPYYYVHISDNARPSVNIDNITVCYPGSGVVSATIPLPTRYQTTTANPSYFQDLSGRYDFTLVSGPAGAATPVYEAAANRTLTNTSTVISNLNKPGEYVFKIRATGSGGPQLFINSEYACAGTSPEDTFSVFVSAQVGSNAGSDQTLVGTTQANLNGNNPVVASGTWTLVSKPSGAADPVIVTPSAYNTNVTGLNTAGTYTFRWTITTGTCTSADDVDVIIPGSCVNNAPTIFYNADNAGNTYGNTGGTGNLLPFVTASNIAGGTYYKTTGTETLNGVRPKSGSTLFSMSGITNAVQASKYYSFNITTAANAPILHFNRFTAIAMDVDLVLSPGGMPNVSYNLRVAIVDPDTGSEINLGNVYINTVSGVNLPVSYKLKPGKTYMVKLYPWNTNGRTITYLDNPRLYFSPVPVVSNADLCLTNLSGTVGTALATYVSSTVPAGMQVRWLQNGFDVTGNPITEGIYSPVYYNTAGSCYAETLGDPITVTNNCAVPFTCDTKYYLTQYGSAATDKTILYTLDNTTNPFTKTIIGESPAGMKVNAIGYNTVDNFIYGMRTDASNATHMVKIDANGVFTDLGAVNNLPAGGFNSGGFDNAGNYYIISFDTSNFYRINITTNTATLVPLSRVLKVNDIAFDPTTNLFYGYEQSAGQLVSISTSGVVNNVGTPSTLGNVYMGAMYSDSNGDIFGNEDDGSGFYQFNKTTGQVVKISESISAFGNDGANCQTAVIKFPADLSITKTDNTAYYIPGRPTVYTIVVRNNNGPYGVLGATVSDPLPAGISAADVSYSVPVLTGGATTSITGPQTGALNDVVGLPVGATITYTVTVNVPSSFTGNLINTVTVTPPANSTDPDTSNNTATDTDINGVCYKPGVAGTALDTKVGITSLNRAGADNADNWPMVRKGGHIALESKTKAFVPNRVAFSDADNNVATPDVPVGIPASNFVEGMMVYDTTNKCLKIYTWKEGDTGMAWHCITTPSCPDNYN